MIEQVIFDCDGVLVDTEIVAAEVMVRFLAGNHISMTVEEYLATCTGKTFTSIIHDLGIKLNEPSLQTAHELEIEIYNNLRAIDGMSALLQSIKKPVALASNSRTWQVEKAMQFLNINDKIGDHYFSSEMVENPKPAPDIYLHAANVVKRQPDECLVIEDSESGAKAALAAGMQVIGFCGGSHIIKGHDSKLENLGTSHICYNQSDLSKLLFELLD